jgi:hypothetical protein
MFRTDWFFLLSSVGLLALPFVKIQAACERIWLQYSPELFFSAVGAASVVILAWERIASYRGVQLRQLMEQVYSDRSDSGIYQTLRAVCNYVRGCNGVTEYFQEVIQNAVFVLRDSGRFHRIDRLYPRGVIKELQSLSQWIAEYSKDWDEVRDRILDFGKLYPKPSSDLLWGMLKGNTELRDQKETFVPFVTTKSGVEAYPRIEREMAERAIWFVTELKRDCRFVRRMNDGTWIKEILERASRIRDRFTKFLVSHGLELPKGSYEDWVKGGGVVDYTQ